MLARDGCKRTAAAGNINSVDIPIQKILSSFPSPDIRQVKAFPGKFNGTLISDEFNGVLLRHGGNVYRQRDARPVSQLLNGILHTGIELPELRFCFGVHQQYIPISHFNDVESAVARDRKSTRLNSSHVAISYAVF